MPSYSKHIQQYYTPANIEQYKESLQNFEWNLFLTDNYYPSLDSIHRFLYNLTRNGREWELAYMVVYKENLDKFKEINNQKHNEYKEKVVENKEKVIQNKEKLKRKPYKNNKKKSFSN
jgi:hypothetical protein